MVLDTDSRRLSQPLAGKRVVVTRARAQASELSTMLRALGAEPVELPTIVIVPPEDSYAALDDTISSLQDYDWLVFTSVNGVEHFWSRLARARKDHSDFAHARVAAIGSATAEALEQRGAPVSVVPERFVAESLLDSLMEEDITGKRFLLPRADIARAALCEGLIAAGARVTEVHAYRTVTAAPAPDVIAQLEAGVDVITFTSSSTVRYFVRQLGLESVRRLASRAVVAAIGPVTASTAQELDLRVDIIADEHTIPGLVQALREHLEQHHG
jgi:uroporphyrinogen-III synthase